MDVTENRRQWLGFALWSLITILATFYPVSWKGGNTTGVYYDGAREALQGKSPYQLNRPPENNYNYSPSYAFLFAPLTVFGLRTCLFLWAFLNIVIYWWGIFCWLPYDKGGFGIFWRVFLAMEINGPIIHGQINPLLVGMVLIGLDAFRKKRYPIASALLVTISNIKVIPTLFLGVTAAKGNSRFLGWCALCSLVILAIPLPWFGWANTLGLYREWIHFLLNESRSGAHGGCADIRNLFAERGLAGLGNVVYYLVAGVSTVLLFRPSKNGNEWPLWIAFGFAAMLMLSPKTEVPTYVIVAPPCALLAYYLRGKGQRFEMALLLVAAFLITILHNDVWPRFIIDPGKLMSRGDYKMIGTCLIWLVAGIELTRNWLAKYEVPDTVSR